MILNHAIHPGIHCDHKFHANIHRFEQFPVEHLEKQRNPSRKPGEKQGRKQKPRQQKQKESIGRSRMVK